MLYPGKLHTIASESEAGKTWLALAATAEELRQGTSVLYIDFEDDEGGVVGRLLALQVDPKMIRQNFHYVRPTEALGGGMNLLDLQSLILQHCPAIVVIDGITEAMTMHGLDPSNNKDIATFGRILPRRLADAGPAVVCLDHVPKAPDTRGRYAIGGVHKLNGLDGAAFILENREPFGIGLTGRSTILIAKDRPGQLRKHAQRRKDGLHIFGELVLTSHDISYTESEIRPVTGNAEEFLPTTLMTKISDALSEHGPMAQRQILATVKGKRQYAIDALALLQRDGYVSDKSPHELLKAYPDGGAS
ncbi:MAG: AAA family ATPase [Mycobacterium sp.]|nr:AAA family ATPase [Mycobacterium sp.]